MAASRIPWTDETWNPVVGCHKKSSGCDNCYARVLHNRRWRSWKRGDWPDAPEQYHKPFSEVQLKPERLPAPFSWRRERKVFVNSVSDLFHEDVPFEFIAQVYAVMAATPKHIYQVLTKRPERALEFYEWIESTWPAIFPPWADVPDDLDANVALQYIPMSLSEKVSGDVFPQPWPLFNVWLGVSIEDDEQLHRAETVAKIPAALRFVSAEPLLGPLNLQIPLGVAWKESRPLDAKTGDVGRPSFEGWIPSYNVFTGEEAQPSIGWVIVGGESAADGKRREMDPEWARRIKAQCDAADVPFFGKQASGRVANRKLPEDLRVRDFPADTRKLQEVGV